MRVASKLLKYNNNNAAKDEKRLAFLDWAQRFVSVNGQSRLYDRTPTDAQKNIGYELAFRSKVPVF